MAIVSIEELLNSGVHFGHRASRWNPKMRPFIFGKKSLIHVINLKETVKGIVRARHFLSKISAMGGEVLFVGTKSQAKNVIITEAKRCTCPYVAERWIGGTLTNFTTVMTSLKRLEEIEKMEVTGEIEASSKKMASSIRREKKKLLRNLDGIRGVKKPPACLVIVDPTREINALKEAKKLGIPTVCLIDTDGDPDLVDICIPTNDDAYKAIKIICAKLADAILDGKSKYSEAKEIAKKAEVDKAKKPTVFQKPKEPAPKTSIKRDASKKTTRKQGSTQGAKVSKNPEEKNKK